MASLTALQVLDRFHDFSRDPVMITVDMYRFGLPNP